MQYLNNPDFKQVEFDLFKNEAGFNHFVLSPQKWIEYGNLTLEQVTSTHLLPLEQVTSTHLLTLEQVTSAHLLPLEQH
jgi:hypothetical protein